MCLVCPQTLWSYEVKVLLGKSQLRLCTVSSIPEAALEFPGCLPFSPAQYLESIPHLEVRPPACRPSWELVLILGHGGSELELIWQHGLRSQDLGQKLSSHPLPSKPRYFCVHPSHLRWSVFCSICNCLNKWAWQEKWSSKQLKVASTICEMTLNWSNYLYIFHFLMVCMPPMVRPTQQHSRHRDIKLFSGQTGPMMTTSLINRSFFL